MTRAKGESARGVPVLVTGGAGYIGSHTVERLTASGYRPVVLDSLARGHRAAVRGAPLIVGEIGDRALVEALLREHAIQVVVHFAALKSVEESNAEPLRYFRVNVADSLVLFEAMAAAGVRSLVYSSSCAVYGTPDRLPVDEAAAIAPQNPYGETKAMVERMLAWLTAQTDLRAVILRYFNAAGASADGENGEVLRDAANLIPIVMATALGRRPDIRINGTDYATPDGSAIRDYVHVADLADAHVRAIEHLLDGGDSLTCNIGTGSGASVIEVIELARRITGRPIPTEAAPRREGDPAAVWASTELAAARLGWRARHDLDAILSSAWRWHVSHPDGFGDES